MPVDNSKKITVLSNLLKETPEADEVTYIGVIDKRLEKNSEITPGEAALMKELFASFLTIAFCKLRTSSRTACLSFTVISSLHPGVFRRDLPGSLNTRWAILGNSTRS